MLYIKRGFFSSILEFTVHCMQLCTKYPNGFSYETWLCIPGGLRGGNTFKHLEMLQKVTWAAQGLTALLRETSLEIAFLTTLPGK